MKLYIRLEPPYEWVRLDGKKVEGFGEVAGLDEYPLSDDCDVVGVVPGEWVTAHSVSLPAKSRKQFQAAVPYALEESISEDVEDMHFVCPTWKAGEESTVLVVAREKMRQWQDLANAHRLPITNLVPDHALLPLHDAADCTLSLQDNIILANDRAGHGVTIDREFMEAWLMDVPLASTIAINDQELTEQLIETHPDRDFRHWPFGYKMAHWLEYPPAGLYDLWTEQYRPIINRQGWRSFTAAIVVIGIAVISKMGFDAYRYVALHAEIRSINSQMQEIVTTTFPEIDEVATDQERMIMERALARRSGPVATRSMHTMLAQAAQVLRRENVTLGDLVYRDDELVISCLLSDFSQVDKLTRQLNARPNLTATLQSSAADDGEIVASYSIRHG